MQRKSEELQLAVQEYFDVDWSNVKYYFRKQIAKCVNECKSQASNAKRIVGTIRHNKPREQSAAPVVNGDYYDSEDEFDYWDSDFDEDFDDEYNGESADQEVCSHLKIPEEMTNQTLSPEIPEISNDSGTHHAKFIPKPPDVPVVSPTFCSSSQKTVQRNGIPRPPLKRPPSQPPPPPIVTQASSPLDQCPLEDYEVPINHQGNSLTPLRSCEPTSSRSSSLSEISSPPETYEIIEPPEENYEIVESPPLPVKTFEKPVLPPRSLAVASRPCVPPPLPQKPKRFQDTTVDGYRSLNRPKLPLKQEDESGSDATPSSVGGIGSAILNSFLGRRNSSASPKLPSRSKDPNCADDSVPNLTQSSSLGSQPHLFNNEKEGVLAVGSSAFVSSAAVFMPVEAIKSLPPEVADLSLNSSMATRPLPPVPQMQNNNHSENLLCDISSLPWFHEIERHEAEQEVQNLGQSGAFVVRPSKRAGKDNPYTLTCLHDGKIFHLNIRQRPDGSFALGKEKKKEKSFPNVATLISFHQNDPILLTSRGESAGQTILRVFPRKC